jgi:hypothetical protein
VSFSLAIVDGDLSQMGSTLQTVFGKQKLIQDLDCWLKERYGGDRFHVNLGSTLQEYIGGIIDLNTQREVESEVLRVLQNYQAVQLRGIKQEPTIYSHSELLVSIEDIQTSVLYDAIYVAIKIRNGANEITTVTAVTNLTG